MKGSEFGWARSRAAPTWWSFFPAAANERAPVCLKRDRNDAVESC